MLAQEGRFQTGFSIPRIQVHEPGWGSGKVPQCGLEWAWYVDGTSVGRQGGAGSG